ncbi:hypothetical protein LTR10_000898 [Elasticomyces elasticus]|nr:hypothetical protein LTR10_000898 [Elasticomyces elasticus]KAK4979855.1 hypothetical protein LTR42_000162 [Elasticomyces elasticus]
MSSPKPALVIVPGASHHPSHYSALATLLQEANYTVTTVDLPSTGGKDRGEPPLTSLKPDILAIQAHITSHLSAGKNVVLICHSFGGISGSAAVQGFLPADREDGLGVVKMIYLAAIIVEPGKSVWEQGGEKHSPSVEFPLPDPEDAGWLRFRDPEKNFYAECTPEVQKEAISKLRWFSEGMNRELVPFSAWQHVESYYLVCGKDQVLPAFVQEMWTSNPTGKWKKVERMETDHSPFLSRTTETVEFVTRSLENTS